MMVELEDDPNWAKSDEIEDDDSDSNAVAGESALDRFACGIGGKTMLPHITSTIPSMLANGKKFYVKPLHLQFFNWKKQGDQHTHKHIHQCRKILRIHHLMHKAIINQHMKYFCCKYSFQGLQKHQNLKFDLLTIFLSLKFQ